LGGKNVIAFFFFLIKLVTANEKDFKVMCLFVGLHNYYIAFMLLYIDIAIIIYCYYYYYCYYIIHILVCISMQATIICKMTMRTCVALLIAFQYIL